MTTCKKMDAQIVSAKLIFVYDDECEEVWELDEPNGMSTRMIEGTVDVEINVARYREYRNGVLVNSCDGKLGRTEYETD